jgi:predicted PurR-regulated permease PerM
MFSVTTIALLILGVKHALLLGVLAGFTEVIPIIGPIIAFVPAILTSYFTPSTAGFLAFVDLAWIRALIVLAFYMSLQYVEGNFFVHRNMGKNLNLHPLTVMFSILAGGYLAGLVGMLLSLPIAASLKVVFETYYPAFIERVGDLMSRNPSAGVSGRESP